MILSAVYMYILDESANRKVIKGMGYGQEGLHAHCVL